jgi:hypothetical protein
VNQLGRPSSGFHTLTIVLIDDLENEYNRCEGGVMLNREDCILVYARHEWGHGFSHDQNRPDTDCDEPANGANGDTLIRGPDYYSVMSYCSKQGKLTIDDVYGASLMYGFSPTLNALHL